jgi:DNA integrity scanning protein DisA with diadenylate cyclase activity
MWFQLNEPILIPQPLTYLFLKILKKSQIVYLIEQIKLLTFLIQIVYLIKQLMLLNILLKLWSYLTVEIVEHLIQIVYLIKQFISLNTWFYWTVDAIEQLI